MKMATYIVPTVMKLPVSQEKSTCRKTNNLLVKISSNIWSSVFVEKNIRTHVFFQKEKISSTLLVECLILCASFINMFNSGQVLCKHTTYHNDIISVA